MPKITVPAIIVLSIVTTLVIISGCITSPGSGTNQPGSPAPTNIPVDTPIPTLAAIVPTSPTTSPSETPSPTARTLTTIITLPVKPVPVDRCTTDSDCVPSGCCHPDHCNNKAYAPDCSGIMCSQICEGPLDCGAGHCACISGVCGINATSPFPFVRTGPNPV